MTQAVPPPLATTLSAGQVFIFARNVNDKRVIEETRALIEVHGADPDNVAAITYEPPVGKAKARFRFTVYDLDADGARSAVLADGSPYYAEQYVDDEDAQPQWHYLTRVMDVAARCMPPSWWGQALRAEAFVALEADE